MFTCRIIIFNHLPCVLDAVGRVAGLWKLCGGGGGGGFDGSSALVLELLPSPSSLRSAEPHPRHTPLRSSSKYKHSSYNYKQSDVLQGIMVLHVHAYFWQLNSSYVLPIMYCNYVLCIFSYIMFINTPDF